MSDTRKLALELHEIRQLALSHATNPQFGNSSVDGEGLSFRDGDGNEIGRIGGGDRGMEVEYTYGPKPLMPSTPIVTADANLLLVQWDGQWADGNEDGDAVADPDLAARAGLDRVEIHASMEPTFVPDPILSFAGVLPATPEGGAHTVGPLAEAGDYYVVLMARGKDGQYSAPSQRVHVVTTVGLMENELFDLALRADEARESADGKNTVHYGEEPTPPDGGFAEGDLWFDTVEDPETGFRTNMPHLWDPSANGGKGGWVSVRDGRFETVQDAIDDLDAAVEQIIETPGGVTLYYQPTEPGASTTPPPRDGDTWFRTASDGITGHFERVGGAWVERKMTDEVIANLHAGKITSGYLDAARIAAGTITADKLLVGTTMNLIPGYMPGTNKGFSALAQDEAEKALRFDGVGIVYADEEFQLQPGEYVVEADIKSSAQTRTYIGVLGLGDTPVSYRYGISNVVVDNEWARYRAPLSIGEGEQGTFQLRMLPAYSGDSSATTWWRNISLRPMVAGTLIENGAITTEKIAVGAITAESGIIGSLDAGVITTGELRGELIRAQSIAGESLAVDAIDGKTITGATIRTSSAGARVEMNSTGLFVKNSLGANTVSMTNGTLSMQGGTITGGTIRTHTSGARVEMNYEGLRAYDASGNVTLSTATADGSISMKGSLTQTSNAITIGVGDNYRGGPGVQWSDGTNWAFPPGIRYGVDPSDSSSMDMLLQGPGGAASTSYLSLRSYGRRFTLRADRSDGGWLVAGDNTSDYFRAGSANNDGPYLYMKRGFAAEGQAALRHNHPTSGAVSSLVLEDRYVWLGARNGAGDLVGTFYSNSSEGTGINAGGGSLRFSAGNYYFPVVSDGSGAPLGRSSGRLVSMGSARKYKIVEEPLESTVASFEDKLLAVEPKTWINRTAAEQLADYQTATTSGEEPAQSLDTIGTLDRDPGVVAEDLEEAGLGLFVGYEDGKPEWVKYDRFGPALIPVVRRLRDRVNELERMMGEMANA